MKIALINPPQPYMVEKHTQVPLGLLYLSALLKREKDVEASVLDLSDVSEDEGLLRIQSNDWDVCGFTATTLDYCTVVNMLKTLKKALKDTAFIVGGSHASACFHDMLEDGWTSVFRGEADLSILRFVDDLTRDTVVDIYNVLNNEIIQDLDWLPYPDRGALPWLGGKVLAKGNKESINIIASRACPRSCTFCASKAIWGNKVRWRKPEAVVDEIKHCIKKYNVKVFRFSDDNMISNKKWTKRFCELVKQLDIIWRMSVRVDEADYDTLCLLRQAGCVELGFGVESFDSNVLKMLNKKITPEQSLKAVENAHKAGIGVRLLMMISTPGETYKYTVDENIKCIEKLRNKFVYISVKPLVPFPGSDIWGDPVKFGVTIKTCDFSKYNMWMYSIGKNGEKKHTEESILCINSMTEDEQRENFNRMLEYTETLPEVQRG